MLDSWRGDAGVLAGVRVLTNAIIVRKAVNRAIEIEARGLRTWIYRSANYRDSLGLLAAAKVRLHLGLDQLYVILRDRRRKAPAGLVFEPVHQLLHHQGHREPVVRLHSVPIAGSAGNDRHHAAGLHLLQTERVPVLPLHVPCKFYQETTTVNNVCICVCVCVLYDIQKMLNNAIYLG